MKMMQMKKKKSFLVFLCLCAMLMAMLGALRVAPLPASAAVTARELNGESVQVNGSPYVTTKQGVVAQRVSVTEGAFTGMTVPSWYVGKVVFQVLLYKWNTDYATTVSGTLLFADEVQMSSPGVWKDPGQDDRTLDFERAFAPGEYLILYYDISGDGLYVPTFARTEGAVAFLNGAEIADVSYRMTLLTDADAEIHETPNVKTDPTDLTQSVQALYGTGPSTDGESRKALATMDTGGVHFTVPYNLTGFVINDIFLTMTPAEIELFLYKWDTDYETTVAHGAVLDLFFEADETYAALDNSYLDFKMDFGDYVFPAGEYLVLLSSYDVNLWTHAPLSGVTAYIDGEPYEDGTFKLSAVTNNALDVHEPSPEDKTPEPPTAAPTETPVQTPAGTPGTGTADVGTADSGSPAGSTGAPLRETPSASASAGSEKGGNTVLWICLAVAAVVVIAVVVVLCIVKRRKK